LVVAIFAAGPVDVGCKENELFGFLDWKLGLSCLPDSEYKEPPVEIAASLSSDELIPIIDISKYLPAQRRITRVFAGKSTHERAK